MGSDSERRAADETTQPGTGSALDSAVRDVWYALFDLQLEWETQVAVVGARDPAGIATAATALVAGWQVARNAQQTIRGAVEAAKEHERGASRALSKYGRALQDLLRGALSRCEGTAAHDDLVRLIAELGDGRDARDGELCESDARPITT